MAYSNSTTTLNLDIQSFIPDPLVTVTMTKSQYERMLQLKARDDKTKEYHRLRRRIDRAKTEEEKEEFKSKIQGLNKKKSVPDS